MKRIFKYHLPPELRSTLVIPAGSVPLHTQELMGRLYLWMEVDPTAHSAEFQVQLFNTGHEVNLDGQPLRFIGTAAWAVDGTVVHVYGGFAE